MNDEKSSEFETVDKIIYCFFIGIFAILISALFFGFYSGYLYFIRGINRGKDFLDYGANLSAWIGITVCLFSILRKVIFPTVTDFLFRGMNNE